MRVSRHQHVDVHLPGKSRERVEVARGNRLVSMNDTDAQRPVHNRRAQWQRALVVVAAHGMHVGRDAAQVLVRLAVAEVAGAKNLLDLPWHEEFLELCREIVYAVGNVQVADDKDEDHLGVRDGKKSEVTAGDARSSSRIGCDGADGAVDGGSSAFRLLTIHGFVASP